MDAVDQLLAPPARTRTLESDSRTGELRLRLDRLEPDPDVVRAQRERLWALSARLSPLTGGSVRGFSNHWRVGLAATLWPEHVAEVVLWISTGALSLLEPVTERAQPPMSSATTRTVPSDVLDALVAGRMLREAAATAGPQLVVVSPSGEDDGDDSRGSGPPGAAHAWASALVAGRPVVVAVDKRDRTWVRGALVLATPTLSAYHRLDALSTMLSDTSAASVIRRLRLDRAIAYDVVVSTETMPGHTMVTCTVSVPAAHRAAVEKTVRASLASLLAAHEGLDPEAGAPAWHHRLRSLRSVVPSKSATDLVRAMALRDGGAPKW